MPIVVKSPYESVDEGIRSVGTALSSTLRDITAERQKKEYGSILQQTLGSLPENASPLDVMMSLSDAASKGVPESMIKNYGDLYSTLQN